VGTLIPEETLAMIGQRLSEPVTGTITSRDAQRFALAAGDRNPLYFDEAAARAAGYRTTLVPPVLLAWSLNPPSPSMICAPTGSTAVKGSA